MTNITTDVAKFCEQGWLVMRGAIDLDELAAIDAAVCDVAGWADADGPGLHHFEQTDAGPVLARSEDFIEHHDVLRAFICDGLISKVLSELFGESALLFKEKINYKLAGGGGYRSHQDGYATLPRNTADNSAPYSFMTQVCMLALDNMNLANGCPELAPETWRKKEGWLSHGKTNMSAAEGASTGYPADEQVSPQRCHRALSW